MRSLPALYQDDDDGNDLSDLGLGTGSKNNINDDDDHVEQSVHENGLQAVANQEEDVFRGAEEPVAVAIKMATITTTAVTTTDKVTENGYDKAIKDYVDFAESKKTLVTKCDEQQEQQQPKPCRKPFAEIKRRMSAPKIEEKVLLLKTRSQSTKDLNASTTCELPKVDIGKRREIFEKICLETKANTEVTALDLKKSTPAKKTKTLDELSPPSQIDVTYTPNIVVRQQLEIEKITPPGKIYYYDDVQLIFLVRFIISKTHQHCQIKMM